ncbi:MAG: LamG domain-containing protein, partial [Planctomycetes bacterium]|nr:LamG domain-containing protein [Planctomycetota bacterium]
RERQKDGRGVGVRTSRNQTLFERGKWVHVAWVWGRTSAVYIDGKLGDQRPSVMSGPPFSPLSVFMIGYIRPEQNINAMVDELRISDIARYTAEFTPPSRDVELRPDKHTRLLMHFNGNLDAESYGHTGPAPVKLTK